MPKQTREVLRYYLDHPHMSESVEGLARWRLGAERIRYTIEEIGAALRWLVAENLLQHEIARTSEPIFSLNREREADARDLVEES